MDTLSLLGLDVACVIGERPDERTREQHLLLDVDLMCDLSVAAASDALADTIDYAMLSEMIRDTLRTAKCCMIERAAVLAADVCLRDARVARVRVHVTKVGAIPGLHAACVTIERTQNERSKTLHES